MSLVIGMVTIDCVEPRQLAAFWSEALGVSIQGDYGDFVFLARPVDGGPVLGLQRVPEPRSGKNRVHVDLSGGSRETEVPRLVGLGATVVDEHEMPGLAWTVLAIPKATSSASASTRTSAGRRRLNARNPRADGACAPRSPIRQWDALAVGSSPWTN